MVLRAQLNMAETWSEDIEDRLKRISKNDRCCMTWLISIISVMFKKRAFGEIAEKINMTGSIMCTIYNTVRKLCSARSFLAATRVNSLRDIIVRIKR